MTLWNEDEQAVFAVNLGYLTAASANEWLAKRDALLGAGRPFAPFLLEEGVIGQAQLNQLMALLGLPASADAEHDPNRALYLEIKQLARKGQIAECEALLARITDDNYRYRGEIQLMKAQHARSELDKGDEEDEGAPSPAPAPAAAPAAAPAPAPATAPAPVPAAPAPVPAAAPAPAVAPAPAPAAAPAPAPAAAPTPAPSSTPAPVAPPSEGGGSTDDLARAQAAAAEAQAAASAAQAAAAEALTAAVAAQAAAANAQAAAAAAQAAATAAASR